MKNYIIGFLIIGLVVVNIFRNDIIDKTSNYSMLDLVFINSVNAEQSDADCKGVLTLLDEYSGEYNGDAGTFYEQYFDCEGKKGGYCSISGARTIFQNDRLSVCPFASCDQTSTSIC